MTKVSVIIPAYNQAEYLAEAIASCLAQHYPALEIVVVDDGSTDDTPRVARSFGDKVHYIRQDNKGLPAARNRGIVEATGEYLCFLDSDDFYHHDKILRQAELLDQNPELGFVYCDISTVDENGNVLGDAPTIESMNRILSGNIFQSLMLGGYFPPHTVMIRKSVLDKVGVFDPQLGGYADYDLWLRVSAAGYPACFIPQPLASYRQHGGNMSKDGEHMAQTQKQALSKIARLHPEQTGTALYELQCIGEELFRANRFLKSHWESALATLEFNAIAPQDHRENYQLLNHWNQASLHKGVPDQKAVWEVAMHGASCRALFLQPPAELVFDVPTGRPGELKTAIAIHPDAWQKPGAGGCEFQVRVDGRLAVVIAIDPMRLASDRCWHPLRIHVPENSRGLHRISFETKTIGHSADYRWAIWQDPMFIWSKAPATDDPATPKSKSLNAA